VPPTGTELGDFGPRGRPLALDAARSAVFDTAATGVLKSRARGSPISRRTTIQAVVAVAAIALVVIAPPARAQVASDEEAEEENFDDLTALVDQPYDTSQGRALYPVRLRFDSRFIVDSDFGSTDATFYNPRGQFRLTVPVAERTSFRFFAGGDALISDWDGTTDLFNLGPTSSDPLDTLYSGDLLLQGAHVVGHSSLLADSEEWAVVGVGRASSSFESGADFEDSITGGGSIGVSYHVDDKVEIVTGVSVSSRLDKNSVRVMPLLSFAWHVTDRVRIRGSTSGARVDFDLTDTVRLFARARIRNERYRLDRRPGPTGAGTVRDRSIPVGLGVWWEFHERLRLSLFGGVVAYHQIRTYDGDRDGIRSITSDPAPFFEIRIDLRP
jgi:hypothetical protein